MRFNSDLVHAVAGLLHIHRSAPTNLAYVVSKEPGLSRMFIERVFGKMRKAGIVKAHRGKGGGYTLTRDLELITLQDMMDVFPSDSTKERRTTTAMEMAERNFFARVRTYAQSYTLADIKNGIAPTSLAIASQHMENVLRS
jgi:Rrf2 family protein